MRYYKQNQQLKQGLRKLDISLSTCDNKITFGIYPPIQRFGAGEG